MRTNVLLTIVLAIVVAGTVPKNVMAQNCGSGKNCIYFCVSRSFNSSTGDRSIVNVPDVVTQDFFDSIINQAAGECTGKTFYTRDAFLSAIDSYDQFGKVGSSNYSKREIAAFFAHVTHETGHFCYVKEINGASQDYCDESNEEYPCVPGKQYFGRGPFQLTWNYNYGAAGKDIGFDGLNNPEIVASDAVISFKTALWFWMNNVRPVVTQGFGATIRAINGAIECNGGNADAVNARIGYYTDYCGKFGVAPGDNLSC